MQAQMSSSEQARLHLPRTWTQPEGLESFLPAPEAPGTDGRLALRAGRSVLAGLTGGGLLPVAPPDRAPRGDPLLTLVHRITQGFTLAEYERAQALGFEGYLEEQLDPSSLDDSEMDEILEDFPTIALSPKELVEGYSEQAGTPYYQLKVALLARAASSRRQLLERMCEFWIDHFNIDHDKELEWVLLPEHERTVIRAHALGSFPQLLSACAFSGAMLYYLDNWLNVRSAPQNNYARELLELHTLSVHGGYSESDVNEVARCFTGWTLNGDPDSPDWLRAKFDPALHARGPKFVLGHVIAPRPAVGQPGQEVSARNEAQEVLDLLARHPSTASFLAHKLIRRFLTPTPPPELVAEVAQTYLATGGDIKAMLRVILTRRNLAAVSPVLAPLYRRPFHLMTSIFRALDVRVLRPRTQALTHLEAMGQLPYDYVAPTGYPEGHQAWGSSLLPRWVFSATFLRHNFLFLGVSSFDLLALRARLDFHEPADLPGLARRVNERLFGQVLSPADVDILQEYMNTYPAPLDYLAIFDWLVLGTMLPSYQWF